MVRRFAAAALLIPLAAAAASAQQALPPPPFSGMPPRSIEPEALPPIAPAPETFSPSTATPPAVTLMPAAPASAAAAAPPAERVFCHQAVAVRLADPAAIPEAYRSFVGVWSDAAWTPQLCAALIVDNVQPDGTASIVYAYGPMGSNASGPGGVLHGTGIIRNGELRFQNSDGSQFAFRPLYADLDGRLTTPQGQNYQAVFKKTP